MRTVFPQQLQQNLARRKNSSNSVQQAVARRLNFEQKRLSQPKKQGMTGDQSQEVDCIIPESLTPGLQQYGNRLELASSFVHPISSLQELYVLPTRRSPLRRPARKPHLLLESLRQLLVSSPQISPCKTTPNNQSMTTLESPLFLSLSLSLSLSHTHTHTLFLSLLFLKLRKWQKSPRRIQYLPGITPAYKNPASSASSSSSSSPIPEL
jgi:hypothetical protein